MNAPTYLLRHGEVANPDHLVYADLPGFGLSTRGRQEATAAAERLDAADVVITSPLQRATETAAIVAAVHGVEIVVDDDLSEWRLLRRWRGHRWEDLAVEFPGELAAYLGHPWDLPFSPESLEDLAIRTTGAIRRWRSESTGSLVIVSHQDPIQASRLSLAGRPLARFQDDKPGHGSLIELRAGPGSIEAPWLERSSWAPGR